LTGSDQYMCEVCNRKCDADKRISIASLPEVLCIHLKRFSFHNWGGELMHGARGMLQRPNHVTLVHAVHAWQEARTQPPSTFPCLGWT